MNYNILPTVYNNLIESCNLASKVSSIYNVNKDMLPKMNSVNNTINNSLLSLNTALINSVTAAFSQYSKNIYQMNQKYFDRIVRVINDSLKKHIVSMPKIKFPNISEETRKRILFLKIAIKANYPIYFEIDTELQDRILNIYDEYHNEPQEIILQEIEHCVTEYFNHEILNEILDNWIDQSWIDLKRREALKEAIEVYEEGRYYSTGSILMCQLGGLITELYDITNTKEVLPIKERKEILSYYHINKNYSEKAKIAQMMSMQSGGAALWHSSANYLMNYTYSSSEDSATFEKDPGRNKICHGEQTNYGNQVMALKAILVTDIVIQLGVQMVNTVGE